MTAVRCSATIGVSLRARAPTRDYASCRDGRASRHDCGRAVAVQPRAVQDGADPWQARRDGACCEHFTEPSAARICAAARRARRRAGARRRSSRAETGYVLETDPDTVRAPDASFVTRERIERDRRHSERVLSRARPTSRSRSARRATAGARSQSKTRSWLERRHARRRRRRPAASASRRSTGRPARRRATRAPTCSTSTTSCRASRRRSTSSSPEPTLASSRRASTPCADVPHAPVTVRRVASVVVARSRE